MSDTELNAPKALAGPVKWLDERVRMGPLVKKHIRKVFPDHWSFMFGEIALWSFVVLLITGTFLTFWFRPSMAEVHYTGSYDLLRGLEMSDAYASTLDLSFDIRAGLLMRQMHHWSAILFIAAMFVHMARILFTGAFRKPRELNYVIGATLLLLGIIEGFAGYSLPDDLLSGTGLRIMEGMVRATPVIGTYLSFFIFGGEFPGSAFIPRLYGVHILLLPGILLALITAHLLILWYQKHTQWGGPGRSNRNVVGYPFMPVYMAKAGGFFFIVFGVTTLMGALMTINPVWKYGPYNPAEVTAGSQPDWYMGIAEGALRIMPNWETSLWGFTVSWNVMIPGLVVPLVLWLVILLYPFLEGWVTRDKREHHLLERPRNAPTRTSIIVALMTLYGLLWIAGGNDIVADKFHLSLEGISWFMRFAVFIGPVIAFIVTKRICIALQRADREMVLHGYESGIISRSAEGGYSEKHGDLSTESLLKLTEQQRRIPPEMEPEVDEHGVRNPRARSNRIRRRMWHWWYGHELPRLTRGELEEAHAHPEHHGIDRDHAMDGTAPDQPQELEPAEHDGADTVVDELDRR